MIRKEALAKSRKIKRKRFVLKLSFYLFVLVFIIAIFIGFFYIPKFKIKEIEINGISDFNKERLSAEFSEVMNSRYLGLLPYNNIFIFPEKKIRAEVLNSYPEIKEINFKDFLPEKVLTMASERELFAVWCFKEESCFFVDEEGFIFKPAPLFHGGLFLKFFDERKDSFTIWDGKGKQVLIKNNFKNIVEFIKLASLKDISIYRIFIKDEGIYDMETSTGWHIIIDEDNNPQETFQNLKIILEGQIKEDYMAKVDYIDLRFGNKVFYKFNDE